MSEKATIVLRLLFAFLVLSGATYYGVASSETRSQLRRLDYLGRQILTSIREGTPLHERALTAPDRAALPEIREFLAGRFRALAQQREGDWQVSYCYDPRFLLVLHFADPVAQPTLEWSADDPRCDPTPAE